MAWVRSGDEAPLFPQLLRVQVQDPLDPRLLNEVAGFMWRISGASAQHKTDYVVGLGTAMLMAPVRFAQLLDAAVRAGLLTPIEPINDEPHWQIIADAQFIHIRLKAEIEQDAGRDRPSPRIEAMVRFRDGDCCRYCGVVTAFATKDNRSGRVSTLDHLVPISQGGPTLVENLAVACKHCNDTRKDARPAFDRDWPLHDPPTEPFYSQNTADFIDKHWGRKVPVSSARSAGLTARVEPDRDPAMEPDTATTPSDPAASRTPPLPQPAAAAEDDIPTGPIPARSEGAEPVVPRVGSGRVGSGQAGTDRDGTGQAGSGGAGARRKRRGRRGRGRNTEGTDSP